MAQAPDTQWTRVYLEENNEAAHSIKETKSGYVIAGSNWNEEHSNYDIYIMNIDSIGNVRWTQLYESWAYDAAYCIYVTEDDGYILTGRSDSYGFFLLRTDYSGTLMWIKSYPGTTGRSVIECSDGGFIAVGKSSSDLFVVRTNSIGDSIWCKTFGQTFDHSDGYSVCETFDGNYAIAGYAQDQWQDSADVWLLKLNPWGDTLWTRMYGGEGMEGGDCVEETSDGGFIIAGRTTSYGSGYWDVYLVKTDQYGNLQWSEAFGGDEWDGAHSVQQTLSGGYFVGAYTLSYGSSVDYYFIETDPTGDMLWYKIVGEFSESDWSQSSIIASDGGFIMAGGKWLPNDNLRDIYVVKLVPTLTGLGDEAVLEYKALCPFLQNYPNPFNTSTTIRFDLMESRDINLAVYDLLGRKIETLLDERLQAGVHNVTWDAENYSTGTYFYTLRGAANFNTKKMILIK
jgi:hypothetical protein